MKKSISRLLPIVCGGMFLCAGCAREEAVRKDEGVIPAAARTETPSLPKTNPDNAAHQTPSGSGMQQNSHKATVADLEKELDAIYFEYDSSTLSETARQILEKDSSVLKKNPQAKIRVEGHCDERGADEYNLALGERRAQAAVRYLITMGISAERLSTISYGKEKPAVHGHDEAAWAKNRRDEFFVTE